MTVREPAIVARFLVGIQPNGSAWGVWAPDGEDDKDARDLIEDFAEDDRGHGTKDTHPLRWVYVTAEIPAIAEIPGHARDAPSTPGTAHDASEEDETAPASAKALFNAHLPLVEKALARHRGTPLSADEVRSYGTEGLWRAAQRFDVAAGVPFHQYARHRINGAILDGIRQSAPFPRGLLKQYPEVCRVAFQEHLAEHLPANTPADPEELISRAEESDVLQRAVARLPRQERELLTLHYFAGRELQDAGASLGLSKPATSRLHSAALETLRMLLAVTSPMDESPESGRHGRGMGKRVLALLPRARQLRDSGASIRDISTVTGLSRATVHKYCPRRRRPAAMISWWRRRRHRAVAVSQAGASL